MSNTSLFGNSFLGNMPKVGITDREWKERLMQYVEGQFVFGRGQRPPKRTKRAIQLQKVESCPKHKNSQQLDAFGRRILCKCGYHKAVSQHDKMAFVTTAILFLSGVGGSE